MVLYDFYCMVMLSLLMLMLLLSKAHKDAKIFEKHLNAVMLVLIR